MSTQVLAIVQSGSMYLVGLLLFVHLFYSYVLVPVTERDVAGCSLHMHNTSLVLDICKSSCNIEIHVPST